jgi:hypothetical protein
MDITITTEQIIRALPKTRKGLMQYTELQAIYTKPDSVSTREFQMKFNSFYIVRRNKQWQDVFYSIMKNVEKDNANFYKILSELENKTKKVEASFVSKMIATIDPSKPVIDAFVLKNLGFKLPSPTKKNRKEEIEKIYKAIDKSMNDFLKTENGIFLIKKFDAMYPNSNISNIKKLDLVLWQTRD